jgi:hypothetical protein
MYIVFKVALCDFIVFVQLKSMTISTRNIPNYEELLEYIPESQYTRNAVTSARRNTKLNATTPIVGSNFTPSLEAEFRIAASQSCLLNLAECYFTIAGELSKKVDLPLRAGPLWILKCMNKVALSIGGTNVYTIQTPALLAKYREIFAQSVHDIKDGSLEQEGYPRDADAPHDLYQVMPQVNPAGGGAAAAYGNPGTVFYDKGENVTGFTISLKLSDIFPVENMKPIFGQDVKVYITFDSAGYTGIMDGAGASPLVNKFNQFFLNTITYTINVDMIAKLNNVYSKQVIEIIDDVNYNFQGVTALGADQQVDIYIPLQTQFETDMIYIALPHAVSNNAYSGITLSGVKYQKPQIANFVAHTPMDYRFMDIRRIVVEADGEILYMRTYDEVKSAANAGVTMTSPVGSVLISNVITSSTKKLEASTKSYPLYDFTTAYQDYKDCRYYHGVLEEKAQTFEDWMFSGFGIAIPVRAFSRLTTGSNLRISINFGAGMSDGSGKITGGASQTTDDIPVNSFFTSPFTDQGNKTPADQDNVVDAPWRPLKNLLVIQKSSKALCFNGFNNCAIKNIAQSFNQEIIVENKEDNVSAQ